MKLSKEGIVALLLFIGSITVAVIGFNKITVSFTFTQYFIGAGLLIVGLVVSIISGVKLLIWWNHRDKLTHTEIVERAKLEAGIAEKYDGKK